MEWFDTYVIGLEDDTYLDQCFSPAGFSLFSKEAAGFTIIQETAEKCASIFNWSRFIQYKRMLEQLQASSWMLEEGYG